MRQSIITSFGLAEDGHPCEAALEFRRLAITKQIADDLSVNGLDLAISFAWAGKAISRSKKLDAWQQTGVDPNTWEIVRAMSLDVEIRRYALNDALYAAPEDAFASALDHLRKASAFQRAMSSIQATISVSSSQSDVLFWMGELARIAKQIPGPDVKPSIAKADNLVNLASFRKKRGT